VGRAAVTAGRFVAQKSVEAYKAVDPDVHRHIAQLPLMTYSLYKRKGVPIEAGTPDGHPPLVFVHGLGGGRGDFRPMAWYLKRMGRKRSYAIAFETSQDIPGRAAALAEFIREILEVTGEAQVDLIAHSLGGVVARLAIAEQGIAPAVKTLITMGTPHGGTYSARLGNSPVTRELRPDSPLIRNLAEKPLPPGLHVVSFWSRGDLVILPPESAALAGSEQIEVHRYTHYGYLIVPASWKAVLRALTGAPSA
jgi:triacylglycerol esterase/lipase EstA (alpha/beta hydrolase family)